MTATVYFSCFSHTNLNWLDRQSTLGWNHPVSILNFKKISLENCWTRDIALDNVFSSKGCMVLNLFQGLRTDTGNWRVKTSGTVIFSASRLEMKKLHDGVEIIGRDSNSIWPPNTSEARILVIFVDWVVFSGFLFLIFWVYTRLLLEPKHWCP